jgi:hypothetical protein
LIASKSLACERMRQTERDFDESWHANGQLASAKVSAQHFAEKISVTLHRSTLCSLLDMPGLSSMRCFLLTLPRIHRLCVNYIGVLWWQRFKRNCCDMRQRSRSFRGLDTMASKMRESKEMVPWETRRHFISVPGWVSDSPQGKRKPESTSRWP